MDFNEIAYKYFCFDVAQRVRQCSLIGVAVVVCRFDFVKNSSMDGSQQSIISTNLNKYPTAALTRAIC